MIEDASVEHMGKKLSLSEAIIKSVQDPMERIKARTLTGGPAPDNVRKMIQEVNQGIELDKEFIKTAREKLVDADMKLEKAVDRLLST
jgi:argininosuccinate lyase